MPATFFLMAGDADPSSPQLLGAFPDLLAEGRVLVAVRGAPDVADRTSLRLIDAKTYRSGLIRGRYEPAS